MRLRILGLGIPETLCIVDKASVDTIGEGFRHSSEWLELSEATTGYLSYFLFEHTQFLYSRLWPQRTEAALIELVVVCLS